MHLGEVVNDVWMVVDIYPDRYELVRIPDGETPMGLGRTWDAQDVERRIVPRPPEKAMVQ